MSVKSLQELEPVAAKLLDRHLATSKEWFPHELVPYHRGRDFDGSAWSPDDADFGGAEIDERVRSALFVNLLTEDNLPYYFRDIERMFGQDGAFATWSRRWTAEEGRHSIVIRDYLTATRAVDPVALERARMAQVSGGEVPQPDDPWRGMAYVALQELATRISHRNTGKLIGDPVGYELMARVAADENQHFLFYRDLTTAALELDPSTMVIAIDEMVCNFAMPGEGIVDFSRHSKAIAAAGIYDLAVHHDQILQPVVIRQWAVDKLTGLSGEAEKAREHLLSFIERLGRIAQRLTARRLERTATVSAT